ncbi:MAG: SH3 domain-containing protein [Candidatus Riflebacteria bacterium]|nr:SH3 domain-containing protein [Candidatus Riflebacteria bacterium]
MKLIMRRWFLLFCLCFVASGLLATTPFSEEKVDPTKPVTGLVGSDAAVKAPEKTEFPVEGTIEVDSALRLREYPWGPVTGLFGSGTKVTVIGAEGDFYKVQVNGQTGYMHKNFVSIAGAPASQTEPDYPGDTRSGGSLPKPGSAGSTGDDTGSTGPVASKPSVIGQTQGDGTIAGALTWAHDQMPGGSCKGVNRNNGKRSSDSKCWSGWCLAFVGTSYGRNFPQLCAPSAIQAYYNCRDAGKISANHNPPAGAVMFTDKTSTNPYGHIFIATGEKAANGEPIIITTTSTVIKKMTLSQVIGSTHYLGWAMP